MIRRMLAGAAIVAGVTIGMGAGGARAAGAAHTPDLTGYWRLDPARSSSPVQPGMGDGERAPREGRGGFGGGRGGMGGRRGGGERGMAGGPRGGDSLAAGRRPLRLPDLIHITQMENLVSFEDSTGAVIQEITTIGAAKDTLAHAPGATVLAGEWKDGRLSAERPGPRGGKVSQSFMLEEGGKALLQVTRMEGTEGMPLREFRRVWLRSAE